MVKLHRVIPVSITALADNGYGIARVGKDRIYVKHALPKERCQVEIIKRMNDGYVGAVVKWERQDPGRVESPCGSAFACGSCHLMHADYETQLKLKQQTVAGWLKQASLSLRVHDVLGMKEPYGYRNKVIITFQKDAKHRVCAGFYEEFSHRVVPFTQCLLHEEGLDAIIATILDLMKQFHVEPYEEDRGRGLLRHVVLRKGHVSKQIMMVLVCGSEIFPARKQFVSALCKSHPEITTVIQNINPRRTSVVLGERERILYGKGYIEDRLCGYDYRISSGSFYQINHVQCEVLYEKALSLLKLQGNERLLDAYCGIGTIGMSASTKVKQVVGVESNAQAVRDAIANAKRNQVRNIRFVCADAGAFMTAEAKARRHYDVLIMDPPRAGSTKEFMDACARLAPRHIVYISCDPKTQIRDLLYFKTLGYEGREMFLVDMFPHTMHVESVVLIVRK